jgi:hypothetical protein
MAHAFFLGVDVADERSDDPGAVTLSLVEKEQNNEASAVFRLDRVTHEAEAPDVGVLADRIQSLVAEAPYIGRTSIIVNRRTEAGQQLVDALDERGLDAVQATMTGGQGATAGAPDEVGVHVSEYDAVDTLASLYRDGRMELPGAASEDTSRLARGIQSFIEMTDNGPADEPSTVDDTPRRREAYDSHVTSAALATWLGTERSFDPTQHLKEDPQTETPGPDSIGV